MAIEISDALIGLAGVIIGGGLGFVGSKRTNETNLRIAREKLAAENKVADEASKAIRALLLEPEWEMRSYEAIRKHIRGFADDELRKLLVACGAVAFEERESRRELWGLRERNASKLQPKRDQPQFEIEPPDPGSFEIETPDAAPPE